jgi:hypothetical protein
LRLVSISVSISSKPLSQVALLAALADYIIAFADLRANEITPKK